MKGIVMTQVGPEDRPEGAVGPEELGTEEEVEESTEEGTEDEDEGTEEGA